jgi:hypothetical protein
VTSGIPVPAAVPATSGWAVADWIDRPFNSPAAGADGLATLVLPPVPDTDRWQLTHAVVSCTSTTTTQLRLYLDGVSVAGLRDGTSSGNFNVADWPLGLWVPPGRSLVAQWFGCSAGAVGTLALQATVLRRVGG